MKLDNFAVERAVVSIYSVDGDPSVVMEISYTGVPSFGSGRRSKLAIP